MRDIKFTVGGFVSGLSLYRIGFGPWWGQTLGVLSSLLLARGIHTEEASDLMEPL